MKHQSAIKCTFALIIYLSLSVSIEISLFSIRCVYRLICSKIGDNKNVQKYTCSYKLRLCFKLWNHLNSWGSILWFMGFLAYSCDVNTWDMRRFSVSERKITLSKFVFVENVNRWGGGRATHEYKENQISHHEFLRFHSMPKCLSKN